MTLFSILTLIYIVLPIVFALICLYLSFNFLKSARILQDIPTSKIRSAAQGTVELRGLAKALLKNPLLGTITKKPCVWHRYFIEAFITPQTGSDTTPYWSVLETAESKDPFVLEDETGECVILPHGATLIPTGSIVWRGHSRIPTSPPTSFLHWFFWDSWGRYRYSEYRLELDVPLYACGMFYTLASSDLRVQNNPSLQAYLDEKNLSSLNILTKEGLSKTEDFIVSAAPETKLIRQLKIKAFIFFITFLFFGVVSVHSTYPIVLKSLKAWDVKHFR